MERSVQVCFFLVVGLLGLGAPLAAQTTVLYVDDDAAGLGDGSSWVNAYRSLQDALADANSGEKPVEIRVAQGRYTPTSYPDKDVWYYLQEAASQVFQMVDGVALRGGYAGLGVSDPNARDVQLYETILSGDLAGDDSPVEDPCDLPGAIRGTNSTAVVSGSGTNETAVLDGFTVSGSAVYIVDMRIDFNNVPKTPHGGMYNRGGSPTVLNCTFTGNASKGLFNTEDSNPTVVNCTFTRNYESAMANGESRPELTDCTFTDNPGRAMYNYQSDLSLTRCSFTNNSARSYNDGGAMYNHQSSLSLTRCSFINNSTSGSAGALYDYMSNSTLSECTFLRNYSRGIGGGILHTDGNLTLTDCIFTENNAGSSVAIRGSRSQLTLQGCTFSRNYGRAIEDGSEAGSVFRDCTFTGNSSLSYSGAVSVFNAEFQRCVFAGNRALRGSNPWSEGGAVSTWRSAVFDNCTFIQNRADHGGALYIACSAQQCPISANNCIFWGSAGPICTNDPDYTILSLRYCDIQGGWPGEGNIDVDPLFADPGYWDPNGTPEDASDDFWVDGDYHLKNQSGRWDPNSQSWVQDDVTSPCIDAGDPNSPVGDEPEPNGGRINMGAYGGTAEASKSYSERIIYVDDDGPADFATIQAAIDDANDGDTVLVAPGIYTGDGNRDIDFGGKAITVKSENVPGTCIVDAQGSWNNWHRGFYFHSGEQADSVLDGFTVTGGYPDLYGGGGILCSRSSPTIRNCVIVGNVGPGAGGLGLGGSDTVVSDCIIAGNRTMFLSGGNADGGGLTCEGDGHAVLENCTIYGNRTGVSGAGGAIYAGLGRWGKISLVNCILFGNRAVYGNQISRAPINMAVPAISVEVRNCLIENDPNALGGSVLLSHLIDCIWGNPLFANPGHWDDEIIPRSWTDGDYHLKSQSGRWDPNSESWVIDDVTSPCIDAGDPNSPVGDEPEPNGGRINMGAYGGTAEASMSFVREP
jgi:hypothetical protein